MLIYKNKGEQMIEDRGIVSLGIDFGRERLGRVYFRTTIERKNICKERGFIKVNKT